ncbi:MAG TPA: hypothetical protein VGF90_00825 [Verrucomicrobiae bacterium]
MTQRLALLICFICCSTFAGPVATTNLLLNPGAESNSLANWLAGGDSGPRVDNGTFDSGIKPHSGTNDFLGGHGSVGTLTQIVPLVGNPGVTAVSIDSGTLLAYVSFWEQGLSQGTPSDDGYVNLIFMDATSNSISVWASPEIDSHSGAWSNYSAYLPIPAGTRFIQYTMNFVLHQGFDLDAFVDDNVLAVTDSIQKPALSVNASPTNTVVSWPTAYSDGFQLLQNTNLAGTNWTPVATPFQISNGLNRVTFSVPPPNQFFRLHHP